jgi:imidazolonepropionase
MVSHQQIIIGPFTEVLPFDNLPFKGALEDEQLTIIHNGGVVIENGFIGAVGKYDDLRIKYPKADREFIDQPAVLLPGLIDAHTHICFAGSRAQDYNLKLQGKTYLEIAREGGGIWRSVEQTRKATGQELTSSLLQRIARHIAEGVTTMEIKSGYGLTVEDELKMLRAIKAASLQTKAGIVSTCLAAHTLPKDFAGTHADYLLLLAKELLPKVKAEELSNRVDIFIEDTAFSIQDATPYLQVANAMGFEITVHADQFTPGSASFAASIGAISADHLEASLDTDIAALAASNTVAVVLPGASLGLGIPFAPARKLLDAGCCLIIASDWNPGSAPMGDLLVQAALLGVYEKLSFTETFAGLTYRAAKALSLTDRGSLASGKRGHMIAFPTNDYREILYHQGKMKPFKVWV